MKKKINTFQSLCRTSQKVRAYPILALYPVLLKVLGWLLGKVNLQQVQGNEKLKLCLKFLFKKSQQAIYIREKITPLVYALAYTEIFN